MGDGDWVAGPGLGGIAVRLLGTQKCQ
ncbi:hypothetical protein SBA5_430039 [Candidatus Sulfotelmatomonas gaucii]|uniref:Uncharacterized protein n=1 Tax=Candidatus Sulfuritelmatomonas gaucii TaxID=2043161 RepID=A0A2N9LLN9_9BACT|nr:hypothetical protein SBA5_430039 [Candidatus Sulfotelmatomonas gaucii]